VTSLPVNGTAELLSQLQIIATDDGRFTGIFIISGDPRDAEVSVRVTPPIGSQLNPADSTAIPLKFGNVFPPHDTTFVQMTLQHQ
jgi:hypothetical protein